MLKTFVTCTALLGLAACAAPRGEPVSWRIQVRTIDEWADLAALDERVAAIGGVGVQPGATAAIAPRWYALTLQCEDRAACKRAAMKLAAQPSLFLELRRDETRRVPPRPSANSAQ